MINGVARPTAKKPLRSKQHDRGLCGGEGFSSTEVTLYDSYTTSVQEPAVLEKSSIPLSIQ